MATSVLGRRTAMFCQVFRGISAIKCFIPVSSHCVILQQIANYNPKPLKFNLKDPYLPDKESEKTPEWQKTPKHDCKLYGRYGSASGIDPATLWPSPARLEELLAEEREWNPPLEDMLKNIQVKEKEAAEKRLAREKLIAANMAKMPKMVAEWRRAKREAKQKLQEEKARRERLLAEARDRFGYTVDPRSSKFQEMVAEIEKEEKKKRKLMKRRLKEEKTPLAEGSTPTASE